MSELTPIDNAILKGADIETVERLMVLRREVEAMEARKFFQADFSQLQAVLPTVQKTGKAQFSTKKGGQVSYGYSKIDDLTEALKPYLSQHGFSYMFRQKEVGDKIAVQCIIMHISGHRESIEMTALPDYANKSNMQAVASTITYLKRITFVSAFGISTTDKQVIKSPEFTPSYSETKFRSNFAHWKLLIERGEKTPDQIFAFLNAKNVKLTQEQQAKIKACCATVSLVGPSH